VASDPRPETTTGARVQESLILAYTYLQMASNDMDLIDTIEARKIGKVRKEVLALINGGLAI